MNIQPILIIRSLKMSSQYSDVVRHCHRWSNLPQNILPDLHSLFLTQNFSDISIKVKSKCHPEKTFRSHKIILSSASPTMKGRLCTEPNCAEIEIDANPESFETFLNFLYSGVLNFSDEELRDLESLFKDLEIQHLSDLLTDENCASCNAGITKEANLSFESSANNSSLDEVISPDLIKTEFDDDDDDIDEDDDVEEEEEEESVWTDNALIMMPELILEEGSEEFEEADLASTQRVLRKQQEVRIAKRISTKKTSKNNEEEEVLSRRKRRRSSRSKKRLVGGGGDKKHLCSLCGRTLGGITAYKRHLIIHSGMRPFGCEICGKDFTQKQRLVVHQRKHTGERPYLCSLCGKTFTESCKLKRHLSKVHKANKDGSELIPGQPVINAGKIVQGSLKMNVVKVGMKVNGVARSRSRV